MVYSCNSDIFEVEGMFLNKNIKWLRLSQRLSLKNLSEHLDIKISTLSSYEERDIQPKIDTILNLVKFYKKFFPNISLENIISKDLRLVSEQNNLLKEIHDKKMDNKSSNNDIEIRKLEFLERLLDVYESQFNASSNHTKPSLP